MIKINGQEIVQRDETCGSFPTTHRGEGYVGHKIDAACKAFFARRGLPVNEYGSFREQITMRARSAQARKARRTR